MSLTCYVIDDEFHAVDLLCSFIRQTPGLELIGSNTAPLYALDEIQKINPAVTFVDVDMAALSGLDLAGMIISYTKVVFTTSYREFGPEAFERDALDYLLKPIAYPRFLQSIEKLERSRPLSFSPVFLFVKTGAKGVLQKVNIADLVYISGLSAYVELHLITGKVITYLSMNELLEQLPRHLFSRIHRSYIVNHEFIASIDNGQVRMTNGINLNIGRAHREAFYENIRSTLLISKRL